MMAVIIMEIPSILAAINWKICSIKIQDKLFGRLFEKVSKLFDKNTIDFNNRLSISLVFESRKS
jgi:hypothetical protein